MTSEPDDDGNYLVRVRAQVMSRDDSSGGWVPLGGGGLSNVSVRKRPRPTPTGGGTTDVATSSHTSKPKHDYLIYGRRISDNTVVLSCTIKKDFEYNKVMPTFHHWRTGDRRFGLTFQAAADARAFDKGVRAAVEDLLDGFTDTSPTAPLPKCTKDVGDDDVFMTLDLPQEPKDSRSSSSDSSSGKGIEHMHRVTYIGGHEKPLESRQPSYDIQKGGGENYSYVQLTAVHEYIYPSDEQKRPRTETSMTTIPVGQRDLSKRLPRPLPPVKKAGDVGQRRCRHCNEIFRSEDNPRGSCEYAPDVVDSTIKAVSCLTCVQCAMYHCASDAEGEFQQNPCHCRSDETSDDTCARRWISLAILAVFVPCLWLYPPLKSCHWCGVRCGLCGGKHEESDI